MIAAVITISVGTNQSCVAPLKWTASDSTVTGGRWLSLSASAGTTPSSISAGINVTGLKPDTYSGSLVFSSASGTQTIPITLVIGQPATPPIISVAPAMLSVTGVIGQTRSINQPVVLSNNGATPISWSAVAATTSGGAWLSVAPARGVLAARHSTTLNVKVTLLATLPPGTYAGSVTITALDSTGQAVGSLTVPVTFIVQAPCTHHHCGGQWGVGFEGK